MFAFMRQKCLEYFEFGDELFSIENKWTIPKIKSKNDTLHTSHGAIHKRLIVKCIKKQTEMVSYCKPSIILAF